MKKAGRPIKENKRNVTLHIKITEEEQEKINNLAKEMGINKSKLIRNLILADAIDINFIDKWNILPIAKKLTNFVEKLKGVDYKKDNNT